MRARRTVAATVLALIVPAACSSSGSHVATAGVSTTSTPVTSATTTKPAPTTSTSVAQRAQVVPSRTQYVVDGRSVDLVCKGRGRIPVVFQAGGREAGLVWKDLVAALGPDVFTCVYDRPTTAYDSIPAAAPTELLSPRTIEDALAGALRQAGVGPRVVLVAHSSGGMNAIVFGGDHTDLVAGAVLFDPSEPTGTTDRADGTRRGIDADAATRQTRAVTRWPDVPLVVLTADAKKAVQNKEATAAEEADWIAGHRRYARLSPKGVQREDPGTDHFIYVSAPAVALATIREVIHDAG